MGRFFCIILATLYSGIAVANDSLYVRRLTDTLSSKAFFGRGYIDGGMEKAADFIAEEMSRIGLQVSRQPLDYPVNTFPQKMALSINGSTLRPGIDFIVSPESKGVKAKGSLLQNDSVTWVNQADKVIVQLVGKLTWSVSQQQAGYTRFQVLKTVVGEPESFSCEVTAKLNKSFDCENIIGTIPGKINPDSIVMFTAHYDHLGAMGSDTWFAGANDNAGGVALMLGIAKRMLENPPPYTVVFVAFAGEEAGLVGSKYFVDHPLVPLDRIKFLINLDLMGNGDEGITVVNATEFPKAFAALQQINKEQNLLVAVNSRGKAANSDHYWFTEKGVPSFFIYTLGKRKAYHDVDDVAATVPWFEVNDLENLLMKFVHQL